jgi:uncharacterized protein (DUF1330 family)
MSSYLIVNAAVTDIDLLNSYTKAVGPTLAGHDFSVEVATNDAEPLEGAPAGTRVVVMKFPDREALLAWYNSDAYQGIIHMRHNSTDGFAVIAEGRS